ncbi:MAG: hypothetical protein PHH85_02245 [Candidatus Methanoperedens sp.]|nr:hypothetical protein [Candidatus Methanoperedens sp.]
MNNGGQTGAQMLASRENIGVALKRRETKSLHIEIYGSCVKCDFNSVEIGNARCKQCINGGGKLNLFAPKQRKSRRKHGN